MKGEEARAGEKRRSKNLAEPAKHKHGQTSGNLHLRFWYQQVDSPWKLSNQFFQDPDVGVFSYTDLPTYLLSLNCLSLSLSLLKAS